MARIIRFEEGFFGKDVGEITDDGRILIPDGIFGTKVVGFYKEDGIYIPDGFGRKKVIDISADGILYLTEDEGFFARGTKIGSIGEDGSMRTIGGRRIGELRVPPGDGGNDVVGRSLGKGAASGKFSGSSDGAGLGLVAALPAIALAVITPIGAIILFPALMGSSSVSMTSKIQLIFLAVLTIVAAALAGLPSNKKNLSLSKSLPNMITCSWIVCVLANCVITVLTEPEPLGILDWALLLIFGSLVCLGWAAAASIITFVALKIVLPKR